MKSDDDGQSGGVFDKCLTVIILTYNESQHIERAIKSAKKISSQIIVCDSYSTDATIEIARSLGAIVLQHTWTNYSQQFQWTLENGPIGCEWVMRLDADEVLEEDLVGEIREKLPTIPVGVSGINVNCKQYFWGAWMRHGGIYPLKLLRIFKHGFGHIEQKWMDEHIVISEGTIIDFTGHFRNENLSNLATFSQKHIGYATREAVDYLSLKYGFLEKTIRQGRLNDQSSAKNIMKKYFYYRLPIFWGPIVYFLYRYVIRLGFMDGTEGFVYHVLQGFWYRFLVAARIVELERLIADKSDAHGMRVALSIATGLAI